MLRLAPTSVLPSAPGAHRVRVALLAGLAGNEAVGTELLLSLADDLLKNYGKDVVITEVSAMLSMGKLHNRLVVGLFRVSATEFRRRHFLMERL